MTRSSAPEPPAGGAASPTLRAKVESLRLGREVVSNGRPVAWVPWGLAFLFFGSTLWFLYQNNLQASKAPARPATASSSPAPAPTANANEGKAPSKDAPAEESVAAQASEKEIALESKGYVIPAHQILVSPKVSGMIMKLNIEEGKRVKKGEVLAELESTDYQADRNRAKASLELAKQRLLELQRGNRQEEIKQAEAELEEAKTNLANLKSELTRRQDLFKRKVLAKEDLDTAESLYKAMTSRVDKLSYAFKLMQIGPREERIEIAQAEVQQAESDLVKSEWRLDNCKVRAPITGTILKKNAEEGNIVNAIAFNGSFSLCDMADLSDLEADLSIQERDISRIRPGQKCRIRAESYPDRTYQGYVSRVMPIADRAKGALPVRVKIKVPAEEEGVYLKPEMGVIVTFLNDPPAKPENQTKAVGMARPAEERVEQVNSRE
ncbi:MAG: efflux RND transporter periplasmic adaptor subunit [Planctomycetales bacterium]